MPSRLSISVPTDFRLKQAVCTYGFFKLAPNRWNDGELSRPLDLGKGPPALVRVRQRESRLVIVVDRTLTDEGRRSVKAQVARMLRVDEDLLAWRKLHRAAARRGFGRLFRSPTLFEDIVKTITTSNVAWPNTVRMNELLCEHAGDPGPGSGLGAGTFPTTAALARWRADALAKRCKVGYRAERIIRLARDVEAGRLDLAWFEDPARQTQELYEALIRIHGVGPYGAHNILQLLGRYDRLPVDSELLRHFRQRYGVDGSLKHVTAAAERHYAAYAPYQFLAYWFELWTGYGDRFTST